MDKKLYRWWKYGAIGIIFLIIIGCFSVYFFYTKATVLNINDAKIGCPSVEVTAQSNGKVLAINVKDGQKVKAGEVLGKINAIVTEEQGQALLKAYKQAQEKYDNLEKQVKNSIPNPQNFKPIVSNNTGELAAKVSMARTKVSRMEQLLSIGAVSAKELSIAKAQLASAEAALASSQGSTSPGIYGGGPSQELTSALVMAQMELAQAKEAYEKAKANNNTVELTAPLDGTVYLSKFKVGDKFNYGDSIFAIGTDKAFWIQIPITKDNENKIHLGQAVEYEIDGKKQLGVVSIITEVGKSKVAKVPFPSDLNKAVKPNMDIPIKIILDK